MSIRDHAKDLVRWCLQGDPGKRPTIDQVLRHEFFGESPEGARVQPMKHHAFLSHAQGDASGTANTLFFAYEQLGLHCWIDMRQEDLTIQGMRQGVLDSDVFVLILSEKVLSSWFCQQELLCAIEHHKKIQIVLEVEKRFHPFDLDFWQQSRFQKQRLIKVAGEEAPRVVRVYMDAKHPWQASMEGGDAKLTELLCAAVDDNLPQAVAYRRREFEQQAMMHELCLRSKIDLPQHEVHTGSGRSQRTTTTAPKTPTTVLVIHNPVTAARMLQELTDGFERYAPSCVRLVLTEDATDATRATADKVLVLLSEGVLEQPALVSSLDHTIHADQQLDLERICIVYDEASWSFGCPAQQHASDAIRKCLESHEALTFRPRDSPGDFLRHEFPAMVKRLLRIMHVRMEAQPEEAIPPQHAPERP